MLIEKYSLEVFTPPCDPGTETWSAMAKFDADISQLLPYLNATLSGAIYNQAAQALTWKQGRHSIAFHPSEIGASNLEDRAEAEQFIQQLIEMVNSTWDKRTEIEPDFKQRQRPTPMALYRLLPGTNCRQCGQPTCFTFALKLAAEQQSLDECPPLLHAEYADRLPPLRAMLGIPDNT